MIWDIKRPAVRQGKTEWPERLLSYALPEYVRRYHNLNLSFLVSGFK